MTLRLTRIGLCAWLGAALSACPTKPTEENPDGNMPPVVGCKLDDRSGILGALGATGQTALGASCTNDYDCSQGQTCVTQKCATNQTDDKTTGELTVDAAGDYLVTVYGAADKNSDVGRTDTDDPVELLFTFSGAAARDARLVRFPRYQPTIDPVAASALEARVRNEPILRELERRAVELRIPSAQPFVSATRQGACSATQFGFKGNCYAEGETFGPLKYSFGNVDVTVVVKKIVGTTAILVDATDTVAQTAVDSLATAFDTVALKRDLILFDKGGTHTGALDTDGNTKIGIVLSSKVGNAGNAGLFDVRDVLAAGSSAQGVTGNGNGADLIWAQPPAIAWGTPAKTPTFESVIGTLAHEYQHLINFQRGKSKTLGAERLFLNEGLSHLAEDLTGYGASNVSAVSAFLNANTSTGLYVGANGLDKDTQAMRGLVYLYLRYVFEKKLGYAVANDGTVTDKGGIAFIEALMSSKTDGIDSLAAAAGSSFYRFATFFTALAASGNTAAPLVQSDCRFTFDAPKVDPVTMQEVGITLDDPSRRDAYGATNLLNGYQQICDKSVAETSGADCRVYMTGGYTFLWEGAAAGATLKVQTGSAFTVRLAAVKVK
jgi:hypothetical protein